MLAVLVLGLYVQVLGNVTYWDHYIRLSQQARWQWLGGPNRFGAIHGVPRPNGACDPCFEDLYHLQWLPPFQQLWGHHWLLPHLQRQDGYVDSIVDTPWKPYTAGVVHMARDFSKVRPDLWLARFDNIQPVPSRRLKTGLGWATGLALLLLGINLSVRSPRRALDPCP